MERRRRLELEAVGAELRRRDEAAQVRRRRLTCIQGAALMSNSPSRVLKGWTKIDDAVTEALWVPLNADFSSCISLVAQVSIGNLETQSSWFHVKCILYNRINESALTWHQVPCEGATSAAPGPDRSFMLRVVEPLGSDVQVYFYAYRSLGDKPLSEDESRIHFSSLRVDWLARTLA
jgi:hypothetical protein